MSARSGGSRAAKTTGRGGAKTVAAAKRAAKTAAKSAAKSASRTAEKAAAKSAEETVEKTAAAASQPASVPAESRGSAETKPPETKPLEIKPLETKPTETKPAAAKGPAKRSSAKRTAPPRPAFDRSIKIAPSILAADFAAFGAECRAVEREGADWVHLDVMDGHFVPNITFGPQMCAALRPHIAGVMDVHLMIEPADPYLEAFVAAGADIVTVHAEAGPHLDRSLQRIRDLGAKAGVALNPATPESAVEHVLDKVDLICVMTVNPGFGGQSFLRSQIEKTRRLRQMIGERPIHLEIDGGVTPETAPLVAAAGADVLVAGSAVFKHGSAAAPAGYGEAIRAIRAAATEAAAAAEA